MTKRPTVMQKVVEAPERAPVFAYVVSSVAFGLSTWRMVLHIQSEAEAESLSHFGLDAILLLIAFCAWPGFMRYLVKNAGPALDFYKRARRAKHDTIPPKDEK